MILKNVKKRNWAMVLYPDSAPSDWKDILQRTGLQCAISPLHDKDINADNTPKKPHYHIILIYEGPTTFNNVKGLCDTLNQPIPQPLDSIRGYYRYLVHKDNPEKYQYDEYKISTLNGFDISNYLDLTTTEVLSIIKEILQLIQDKNITEFQELVDILRADESLYYYLDVCSNKYNFINTYITSKRHSINKNSN